VRSRRQQDSSGFGLWSTNDSELDLTSGLSGKTSRNPRLRRSNMNASFMAMRVSQNSAKPSGGPNRSFLSAMATLQLRLF
jgi:hypothetical protein